MINAALPTGYNVSPSLIKSFRDVVDGEHCGIQFRDSTLLKLYETPVGAAAELGNWFEYECTGAKPRDGHTPVPVYNKDGKTLSAPYKYMEQQVQHWKRYVEACKITDIETGVLLEYNFEGVNIKGIADIRCKKDGVPAWIDMKSTGLIDDIWSKYGWGNCTNEIWKRTKGQVELKYLLLQAIVYPWLEEKLYGTISDFYYYVAANNNYSKRKIIKATATDEAFMWFEKEIKPHIGH